MQNYDVIQWVFRNEQDVCYRSLSRTVLRMQLMYKNGGALRVWNVLERLPVPHMSQFFLGDIISQNERDLRRQIKEVMYQQCRKLQPLRLSDKSVLYPDIELINTGKKAVAIDNKSGFFYSYPGWDVSGYGKDNQKFLDAFNSAQKYFLEQPYHGNVTVQAGRANKMLADVLMDAVKLAREKNMFAADLHQFVLEQAKIHKK